MAKLYSPISFWRAAVCVCVALAAWAANAADYPAPKEDSWIAKDFRFHTGQVMPELRINYVTVGAPTGEPVLILHGTTGSARSMLTPAFAGELFGAGQPLDASRYYIIIPDAIGTGKSTKPSDGLRANFPAVQLRRHGRRAIPAGEGTPGREAPARGDGQFDGRHADLDLGREASRRDGRDHPHGVAAHRDVQPQLDAAPPDRRFDPQRPRVEQRQLHQAAAQRAICFRVLRHRHQRRRRWPPTRPRRRGRRPTRFSMRA